MRRADGVVSILMELAVQALGTADATGTTQFEVRAVVLRGIPPIEDYDRFEKC